MDTLNFVGYGNKKNINIFLVKEYAHFPFLIELGCVFLYYEKHQNNLNNKEL